MADGAFPTLGSAMWLVAGIFGGWAGLALFVGGLRQMPRLYCRLRKWYWDISGRTAADKAAATLKNAQVDEHFWVRNDLPGLVLGDGSRQWGSFSLSTEPPPLGSRMIEVDTKPMTRVWFFLINPVTYLFKGIVRL